MIDTKKVHHIAKLAQLALKESEIRKFQKELSLILDYFELLKEVDVSKTEPTFYLSGFGLMREDKAEKGAEKAIDKLIELAPDKKGRHIKVKAVFQ